MIKKGFLLALMLCGVLTLGRGTGQAYRGLHPSSSPASSLININQPYWPSFGYDRQNTSRSPHPGLQTAEIAWTYPAARGRVINQQQTVDADGTVYFGTWGSAEGDERAHGLLYALNPDGTQKWVYDPGGPAPNEYYLGTIETSPTIGPDGTIYIGRGDGILRAVNPTDGTEKWRFETIPNSRGRGQIISSPAVAQDGTIYFGTLHYSLLLGMGNNVFYALNPDGTLKWTYPADADQGGTLQHWIFSNPAIADDGTVYFSAGYTTYALNPDGSERWHKTTIYQMYNPAVGPDGTIYVQAMGTKGVVYALNPDGTKKWTYTMSEGETVATKVSIGADGTLYVGSGTKGAQETVEPQNIGKLYALTDCGQGCVQEKWSQPVDFSSSVGTPTIDGEGIIYVALRGDTSTQLSAGLDANPPVHGRVVALRDTGNGAEILWTVEAQGEIWLGNPVIGPNNTLYFADAVCIDYTVCDEDTDIPSVYAVKPSAPPAGQCISDANNNGRVDVVDIQAAAANLDCLVYLPVIAAYWRQPWPTPTPTPSPTPTPTPTPSSNAIVLADRASGLELVSAPATVPITVGHVAYLPVEVQNYHRRITVSVQTLIHTYVNDVTAPLPGESPPFTVGRLEAPQSELKLQTLRMRSHPLTLTLRAEPFDGAQDTPQGEAFSAVGQVAHLSYGDTDVVSTTIAIQPAIQPRTPLFGVHSAPFYDGLPEPFTQIWGPNCGSCPTTEGDPPGSTRDIRCARQQDSCRCHPIQKIRDPDADAHTRHAAPQMQRYASQFLRSVGGWGQVQIEPGRYLWDGLDWAFNDLAPQERDYSPLFSGIMDGNFGWMTCPAYTNPDGSVGFYDPHNTYLLEQYGAYVRELTARYAPELRFIETGNEPCYGFYLCPCLDPGGSPCDATSGPNQPACALGHDSEAFAQTYGPFLSTSANVAAEAIAEANPDALLIAGALEKSGEGLTVTTRYMIEHGLLDRGNVALMIHQFPLPWPNWLPHPVDCAYFQVPGDPWWLPPGCETAPPFEDYTTPAGRPIHAQDMWRGVDEKIDAGRLLHDAEDLGVLNRFYLFDTELHAGWHDTLGGEPNQTTTPAREAMAGLRIGAINAHQRYLGLEFIFAPADPRAYNLMVKHLAGATPVYAWDAPLTDADYAGLVYKLFTRDVELQVPGTFGEDIIALWSNADGLLELALTPSAAPTHFKQVTLTRLADAHGSVAITTTNLSAPPATIPVQPLREFYFLSVISDRPGFGWLAGTATHNRP